MRRLGLHIDELEKLLNEKGFDGHFLCNSAFPGKLRESLHQHLMEMLQCETHIPSFYLTTYSLWKDEESPYVQCDFKVRYDKDHGLGIDKVDAKYVVDRSFNPVRTFETRLKSNEDLPTRENINSLVGPRKRSLKL